MIIDFHTHIFPEKIAKRTLGALASASNSTPYTNGTEAGLISAMESTGVALSVNLPVLTKPTQFESILSFGEQINEKYSAQISSILSRGKGTTEAKQTADTHSVPAILSFAGIHPADEAAEEHLEQISLRGFLGIKIHPDYQGTFFDDDSYIRIFKKAKSLGLITVTHAGIDGAFVGQPIKCTPERVLRALDKIGGYDKLVLAHLGGGKVEDDVIKLLAGEQIYLDTAYLLSKAKKSVILEIIERHGANKILFATDSPWSEAARDTAIIKSLGLGVVAENKIFFENALNLLTKQS